MSTIAQMNDSSYTHQSISWANPALRDFYSANPLELNNQAVNYSESDLSASHLSARRVTLPGTTEQKVAKNFLTAIVYVSLFLALAAAGVGCVIPPFFIITGVFEAIAFVALAALKEEKTLPNLP